MSYLKERVGRIVAVTAFMLVAVVVIGVTPASAAPTCSYSSGALTVTNDQDGGTIDLQQDSNGQVFTTLAPVTACSGGPVLIANLTSVSISGGAGDQRVNLWMSSTGAPTPPIKEVSWGKVNFTISLGTETGPGFGNGDELYIYQQGTAHGDALDLAMGANGIDLNNDGDLDATVASIEFYKVQSDGAGNDVINAGGTTATGAAFTQNLAGFAALDYGIQADLPVGHASCVHEASPQASGCHDKTLTGGAGSDRISAAGDGYSTVAPGAGDDFMNGCQGGCATGGNNLDYSASPNAINANFPGDTVNGWGLDTFNAPDGFTDIVGSKQNDILLGTDAEYNYFMPGAGDDTVTGGATASTNGDFSDAYDVSDAEDGVQVDLVAGTSKGGSGNDTLSGIEDVYGTEADDTIMGGSSTTVGNYLAGAGGNDSLSGGPANANGPDWMDGGSGIDVVDYGLNTSSTTVNLNQPNCQWAFQDFFPAHAHGTPGTFICVTDSLAPVAVGPIQTSGVGENDVIINTEDAILGTGNDVFNGSPFNNTVWPNGGQNVLGCAGAIGLLPTGCGGIDTVNYSMGYEAGVTINLAGGGPSGGNADSIVGFANAVGTQFADTIIGTDANSGNSLKGGKGNDDISGNSGPDFALGGAGKDSIRGGGGDDTLKGGDANDNIRGAGGDDNIYGQKGKDKCDGGKGDNVVKCEKKFKGASPKAQARATAARIARLVAIKP